MVGRKYKEMRKLKTKKGNRKEKRACIIGHQKVVPCEILRGYFISHGKFWYGV